MLSDPSERNGAVSRLQSYPRAVQLPRLSLSVRDGLAATSRSVCHRRHVRSPRPWTRASSSSQPASHRSRVSSLDGHIFIGCRNWNAGRARHVTSGAPRAIYRMPEREQDAARARLLSEMVRPHARFRGRIGVPLCPTGHTHAHYCMLDTDLIETCGGRGTGRVCRFCCCAGGQREHVSFVLGGDS